MKLNIKLFATLKTKVQSNQISIELPGEQPTVSDLLIEIAASHPALETSLKSVLVAVNSEYAFPGQIIQEQDEIALFPPVSGG